MWRMMGSARGADADASVRLRYARVRDGGGIPRRTPRTVVTSHAHA